jgi:hypothetical protein
MMEYKYSSTLYNIMFFNIILNHLNTVNALTCLEIDLDGGPRFSMERRASGEEK